MAPPPSSTIFIILAFASFHVTAFADSANGVPFSYKGDSGPDKWGILSPQFKACLSGKMQSPIDIVTKATTVNKNLKSLDRYYHPVNSTLVNHGVNIGVVFTGDAGVLVSDGKSYSLKQMHWHCPSEHQIDGVQGPAELHLVHRADDGSIAVVGLIYQFGDPDPLIASLKNGLDELAKDSCASDQESQVQVGTVDVRMVKKGNRKYFRYNGSLTTPPCNETVQWYVLAKARPISKDQVAALKAPLSSQDKDNSRPCQPLHGRTVEFYDESSG